MKNLFREKLGKKDFVNIIELVPPKGANLDDITNKVSTSKKVQFFSVVDSPLSDPRMHPMALCSRISAMPGKESVMHYTCRDRNKVGIEADLLAAYNLGVKNILALTGDPCKGGKSVFEFSSLGLIEFVKEIKKRYGLDFFVGCGMNINATGFDNEIARTQKKIEKGAEFVITQPCLDFDRIKRAKKNLDAPIILGFVFSFNKKTIHFLKYNVPGLFVSDKLVEISNNKQKMIAYYTEMIQTAKGAGIDGICFEAAEEFDIIERLT